MPRFLIPIVLLALVSSLHAQSGTLDQNSNYSIWGLNGVIAGQDRVQAIEIGVDGMLEGIEFEVWGFAQNTSVLNVYGPFASAQLPTGGPAATFQLQGQGSSWFTTFVDMTSANLAVNAGEFWAIEILGAFSGSDYKGGDAPLYPHPMWERTPAAPAYQLATSTTWPTRMGFKSYVLATVPTISISGSCPGPATLVGTNMTPGGPVGIGFGFTSGTTLLPGGACAGTAIGVLNAQVIGFVSADLNGDFSFPGNLGPAACGGFVQVVDIASCEASNVVSL